MRDAMEKTMQVFIEKYRDKLAVKRSAEDEAASMSKGSKMAKH